MILLKTVVLCPGKWKKTLLWKDRIMGNLPLNNTIELTKICEWLSHLGLHIQVDISSWDRAENWKDWVFPWTPKHLLHKKHLLLDALTGLALVHFHASDKWSWGKNGTYSTVQGFIALQSHQAPTLNSSSWKQEVGLGRFWTPQNQFLYVGVFA